MTITSRTLRARRLRLGLSQALLGRLAGYAQATVSAWECGTRTIPPHIGSELDSIAEALDQLAVQLAEKRRHLPGRSADSP
jgi:transcriptional regulator with XRE-family HTH domain